MKSREAIRKDIIHYASLTWEAKNFNNMNPLIQLMVEEISHELFLLDNKMSEMSHSILNKLVSNLSPLTFNYIRPAHAVLKIEPVSPVYGLSRKTGFILKELPSGFKEKGITSIAFTPAIDTQICDITITRMFYDDTLWAINKYGQRKVTGYAGNRTKPNTVWIGLEIDKSIKELKNTPIYLDFGHLPDYHEYYDSLSGIRWATGQKILNSEQGFPVEQKTPLSTVEQDVMDFYKDHYQTIKEIEIDDLKKSELPEEISGLISSEGGSSLPPVYWISASFPANFLREDIKKLTISLNAVPVINRYFNYSESELKETGNIITLTAKARQEFLDMETVIDSSGNTYRRENDINETETYLVEPVKRENTDDPRIADYLERLLDVIQDERTAFPGVENGNIANVLTAITSIQDKDTHRIEINRLNEQAEVALLKVNPKRDTGSVTAYYWTTHAELMNGIPAGTQLMADKLPELNKSEAIFLNAAAGGQDFYNQEALKAISRFYMVSKDRILTKNDILSFCRMELGESIDDVDVVRKAVISHKQKAGIIIVMEIRITPEKKHILQFKQKGLLKSLLIRLRKRSPGNFNYKSNL